MAIRLTAAARYAVEALVHLVGRGGAAPASAESIAGARGIPARYLNKVLGALSRAGIVRSLKGPNGGCTLARPPDRITLLEVVEAVDGPIPGGGETWDSADRALDRRLGTLFEGAAETVRRRFGLVKLSGLVGRTPFTFGRGRAGGRR
jgi:Rrf2 family protein